MEKESEQFLIGLHIKKIDKLLRDFNQEKFERVFDKEMQKFKQQQQDSSSVSDRASDS